jgi:Ca-activated chloride channel family protein
MTRKFIGLMLALAFGTAVLAAQQTAAPAAQPTTASPAAAPQQPAGQAPDQASGLADYTTDINTPTIKIGVNEVNLIFTVTDKRGHYKPNLKLSDFALLDDQKGPSRVTSFHQQINLPLRVGIMIDTSSSIHQRFEFEQQAATEFLLQILKSRADRAFVMGFDVVPTVTANWSNNLDALQTGITKMKPGGGTALYDAVYTACRDKLLDASRGQEPVRKAIILLSDGEDDQSRVYLGEAIKECQRAETLIYAVSTNWTPSRGAGDKVMEQMANETGGQSFFPPSVEEISQSFTNIEQELRSQYALTYTPADFKLDGSFRPIYLYCNDRRYVVRAKKGYFAPRQ